jgi:ESS family glutamate:Na+ symporter
MSLAVAFGLASIMLCIGLIIRVKVPFIRNMLIPTSIIAGTLGFIIMNTGLITTTSADTYIEIVTYLFTMMFIALGLTGGNDSESQGERRKSITQGAFGIGLVWTLLYSLTPLVAVIVLVLMGSSFGMDPLYGLLIPFAFAQGPGQAATFGGIIEQQHGLADAANVAVTFAAIGFIICFVVGVPLAKYGIRKGLAKHLGSVNVQDYIKRGYFSKDKPGESIGNETTFSGNIDTMTFHFAVIGVGLIMAMLISEAISYIPNIGPTFAGLLFIYGLFSGYILKFIMKKLDIAYLLDDRFLSRITGWATDYLIVASFMGVQLAVIGGFITPIIIVSIVVSIVIFFVCIYFGQRMGASNDFERTLGLFGASTGQVHSGLALIRIIDPAFKTSTAIELGLMNLVNTIPINLIALVIISITSGFFSWTVGVAIILASIIVYLILMKVFKVWGKKTYDFKGNKESKME